MGIWSKRKIEEHQYDIEDVVNSNWLDEDNEWGKLQNDISQNRSSIDGSEFRKSSAFDVPPEEDLRKVEVNIKLSLPKFNAARLKWAAKIQENTALIIRKLRTGSTPIKTAAIVLILILGTAGFVVGNKYIFNDKTETAVAGSATVKGNEITPPTNNPAFNYIEPQGRPIAKEKIVYDHKRNFAKYDDDINGTPISVSQQPLPAKVKADPENGVKKLANDFGASEVLKIDGQELYFGQNDKGPQTLIFAKNDLLVFILTTQEVDRNALTIYAGNLN